MDIDDDNTLPEGGDDLRASLESAFQASIDANPDPVATPSLPADGVVTSDQPDPAAAQRDLVRDPVTGKFAPKPAEDTAAKPDPAKALEKPDANALPDPAKAADKPLAPPPGWSPTSKRDYAALPQHIKADIAKREDEVNQGLSKLQSYKGLDPFVDMARSSGTTLPEAVQRYVAAEQLLEKSPVEGLKWLCQNYKIDPRQLIDGAQPEPGAQPQQQQPNFRDPRVDQIMPAVQQLISQPVKNQIAQFFADPKNVYAENVADDMTALIKSGQAKDLAEAYDKACWARSDIRPLLIEQQAAATAQQAREKATTVASNARAAAKSITGTPLPGASNASDLSEMSIREQLERQFAASV